MKETVANYVKNIIYILDQNVYSEFKFKATLVVLINLVVV